MATYKLIKNGEVVNTIVADASFFDSPSDMWDSYEEVIPPVPEPVEVTPTVETLERISPVEFKLRFTPQERVAIRAARQTDAMVDDFFDIIDDPRLTYVDLTLTSTIEAVNYLASVNLIAADRVDEILDTEVIQPNTSTTIPVTVI